MPSRRRSLSSMSRKRRPSGGCAMRRDEDIGAVPKWSYNGTTMPVDLSIKRVPDVVARQLRRRAEHHHRSLQGELMAILQEAVAAAPAQGSARETAAPVSSQAGRRIAPASESALIIRQAREGRTFTVTDLHRFVSALGPKTSDDSTRLIRQGRDSR